MESFGLPDVIEYLVDKFPVIVEMGALILVNHALQAMFFSLAVTHFISFVVRLSGFAYADMVDNSKIIQLLGFFLM